MRNPIVTSLAGALLLAALAWPGPAQAHSELVASSPADGSTVSLSTDRIVLVFDTPLAPLGNAVLVRGPDADDVTAAAVRTDGDTLEVQVDLVSPGRHTVEYRFVGQDGHAVTGEIWFSAVAGGPPLSATAAAVGGTPLADTQLEARAGAGSAGGGARVWLLSLIGFTGGLMLLHAAAAARQREIAKRSGGS